MLQTEYEVMAFNNVVLILKTLKIDGESTQALLEQIGMDDQMLRQLIMSKPLETINQLVAERTELDYANHENNALKSHVLMLASKFLCADYDEELIDQIVAIANHEDESDMIDNVEVETSESSYVRVWEKVVDTFTCAEFLEQIEYVDNLFE